MIIKNQKKFSILVGRHVDCFCELSNFINVITEGIYSSEINTYPKMASDFWVCE